MTTFFYRAIAPDGKVRTGSLTAETDKLVARELRRQGLTPVFVGAEEKKNFVLKLPGTGGGRRQGRSRLASPRNSRRSSPPACPSTAASASPRNSPSAKPSAPSSPISCASSRAANRWPTALPRIPTNLSRSLHLTYRLRAGEALRQPLPPCSTPAWSSERLRDELRNFIDLVHDLLGAAHLRRRGLDPGPRHELQWLPRFASVFSDSAVLRRFPCPRS